MREATGELNATVFVVIAVGILSTFFFTVFWPMLKRNLDRNTQCSKAICKTTKSELKNTCVEFKDYGDTKICTKVRCTYYSSSSDKTGTEVVCPYKG